MKKIELNNIRELKEYIKLLLDCNFENVQGLKVAIGKKEYEVVIGE